MRILLISAYYPPEIGSASHLFHELAVSLSGAGNQVAVLTSLPAYNAPGDLSRYRRRLWVRETIDGVDVVRIAAPRLPGRLMAARALWQFGLSLNMAGASAFIGKHDAAIVYSPPLPLGLTAWAYRALKGVPFILNVQDLFPQSVIDLGLLKNRRLISVFEKMESFVYSRASVVTVHSEQNGTHVVGKGADRSKVAVLPNWVDTDAIDPKASGKAFRAKWDIGDRFVVSFGGVLAFSQDLDTVLDAASMLRDRDDILWLIAGEGVEKERLVARAADLDLGNVKFLPMLPKHEYFEMLSASDLCLATLRAEVRTPVVPSKIMSIMAAGKPVLASMHLGGDAPKLLREANCGVTVEPGNANALGREVIAFSNDRNRGTTMGRYGRTFAERRLSLTQAAASYSRLLDAITSGRVLSGQHF